MTASVEANFRSPDAPAIPEHELLRCIGRGSYGEVWLARNMLGAWRAIKIIRQISDSPKSGFDREFSGVQKFEPVSRSSPGLMHILQVGRGLEGQFFYCIMELADDACADEPWSANCRAANLGVIDP